MSGTTEQPQTTEEPEVRTQEPGQPQPEPPVQPPPQPDQPDSPEPAKEPVKEPVVDWRDKRIATLTRRLRELQEQRQQPQPNQPQPQQFDQSTIEARARELANVQEFNRRCDETALAGRATFGETEFNGRIGNLQKLVDNSDQQSVNAYNALLQAALDTGEPAKVLHDLGGDMNEAQRILSLPATRMAVELTKRAFNANSQQVSQAPKPIQPVGVRGNHQSITPDDPDRADHLSTQEWMRRREQQMNERRNQR